MVFGFIIPTCCRNVLHFNQLKRCINSIRKYHDNPIILIDDGDGLYDLNSEFSDDKNIQIYPSIIKGSADQQVFYVFMNTNLFDKMVFIQDSMLLNRKLEDIDEIEFKYLWHFTNHRKDWDYIREPNKYITHTEYIRECVRNDYSKHEKMFNTYLNDKDLWVGCFGCCCIISKRIVKEIDSVFGFVNMFMTYNTNRKRRVNESIFSIMCKYMYPYINFEESYDGLYYDGFKVNSYANKLTGFDGLVWCCKNYYVSKISFNRP